MKKIFSNKYVRNSLFVIGGIFMGWLFFHSPHKTENKHEQNTAITKVTTWTCAMHPQIRMDKPGKCPICGMDLIPLNQSDIPADSDAIHLTKDAAELANVQTSLVTIQKPIKEVRLYGKVQADERLLQSQVAQFPGRIEKLMVNFTGEIVDKGQALAVIYSPELVTAQQELLETVKTKQSQPEIYEAAKAKLRQLKITESQIAGIESSGVVQNNFELKSEIAGIVIQRRVNTGDYITQGTVMYDLADLSKVWVMFDAYESDLLFMRIGDKLIFTVQALPGVKYTGNIIFIDPVIDPVTRVSKVRVEINNQSGKLKPEMFATGIVNANLTEFKNNLIIPRSAVLWTGKRSIVYVKQTGTEEPIFKIREVELGPLLGNSYVIISGLNEGEKIVTQGTFSVDAAAQLEGKPSMMNPASTTDKSDAGNLIPEQNEGAMKNSGKNEVNTGQKIQKNIPRTQLETFIVSGNCEMCKERIENAAKSVKGITAAVWDMQTKIIQIEFSAIETSADTIQMAIAKAGHDTEKFTADTKTYDNLPDCCKYRNQ
jgi:Cu(I)/Ag(I) efflux system membrane fusion protein